MFRRQSTLLIWMVLLFSGKAYLFVAGEYVRADWTLNSLSVQVATNAAIDLNVTPKGVKVMPFSVSMPLMNVQLKNEQFIEWGKGNVITGLVLKTPMGFYEVTNLKVDGRTMDFVLSSSEGKEFKHAISL